VGADRHEIDLEVVDVERDLAGRLHRIGMKENALGLGDRANLGDRLNKRLHDGLDEIFINGSVEHRLPHSLNISFAYVEGESLLMGINDVAVSSGSACTSASLEPSYVLKALGAGDDLAHSSIRFGLGRWTTDEEVDYVVDKLITVVTRLREMSPLYELAKEGVDLSTMQWEVH
jgi:cysteine desulfurase